jgi:hypothetical protein
MPRVKKMTKFKVIDWPAVSAWVTADIARRLQASLEFMNAEILREQCWNACQVLRENRPLAVPYFFVGRILGIDKGTVK